MAELLWCIRLIRLRSQQTTSTNGRQFAMRVRLKGINRISKRLADGSDVTYYYAWKGGPRLEGKPGSPEFHTSYNSAIEHRRAAPKNELRSVLDEFETS